MIRILSLVLPILLTATTLVRAQEGEKSLDISKYVPLESLEMLSVLEYVEHEELLHRMRPLYGRLHGVYRHVEELREQIDEHRTEERRLRGRLHNAEARVSEFLEEIEAKLLEAGLDEATLARARKFPRGPLHVERHAHGAVLEAPDLSEEGRKLLDRLVIATDASQRALRAARERFAGDSEEERSGLRRGFDRQVRAVELRFWKVVGYVLDRGQMLAIREGMPYRYRYHNDIRAHIHGLPGLTSSQASRIEARFTEMESETAADRAESTRLQRKLGDSKLEQAEREEIRGRMEAAHRRHREIRLGLRNAIRTILSEEQLAWLRAVPPLVSPQDLERGVRGIEDEIRLSIAQRDVLERLRSEAQEKLDVIARKRQHEIEKVRRDVGEDAPQSMMMRFMSGRTRSDAARIRREFGRRVVLEILTPDQVVEWVVSPRDAR